MIAATTNLHLLNDEELVALISAENKAAFNVIYNRCRTLVFKVALRYLKSETTAEEVVQEVFMKLWMERTTIKEGIAIKAWLCVVAKNNTLNKLKRKAVEWKAVNQIKSTQVTYEDQQDLSYKDCNQLLEKGLQSLSENQRKVFYLVREENQSYVQIADHMNISPLTVKTHMSRALSNLKYFFAAHFS